MEPDDSLPCSQVHATGPCLESHESSSGSIPIHFSIILPSMSRSSAWFPPFRGFPTKICINFSPTSCHALSSSYSLNFVIRIIGPACLMNSANCEVFGVHLFQTSSYFLPLKPFFSILFSNTLHPYTTISEVIILNILVFYAFLNSRGEDKKKLN